ncbi:MAG: class I SAM-dependent methyltransferase, partial [Planctomycetota bacterium]
LEKGIEYVAVEPNQQMAASLEKRGAVVICAMVPPLPAVDKEFDVVVMINVMEHMNSMQDALQIALQIRTVLKPKGKVVICSPDYLNLRHNFFNCDFSHNYVTTRRRLKQLLVSAGFNNIKSCYLSGPLTGFVCFLVTAVVSRLPFGLLNAFFPDNKIVYKLYKMQLAFSRKVLILAEKSG